MGEIPGIVVTFDVGFTKSQIIDFLNQVVLNFDQFKSQERDLEKAVDAAKSMLQSEPDDVDKIIINILHGKPLENTITATESSCVDSGEDCDGKESSCCGTLQCRSNKFCDVCAVNQAVSSTKLFRCGSICMHSIFKVCFTHSDCCPGLGCHNGDNDVKICTSCEDCNESLNSQCFTILDSEGNTQECESSSSASRPETCEIFIFGSDCLDSNGIRETWPCTMDVRTPFSGIYRKT